MKKDFDKIKDSIIDDYDNLIQRVRNSNFENYYSFDFFITDNLNEIIQSLKFIKTKNHVYKFSLENDNDYKKLSLVFKNNKIKNPNHALSRFIKYDNNTKSIYVGSSTTDIRNRIKTHLGINESRSTYALYLKDWFPNDLKIKLEIISFEDNEAELVELFEYYYWFIYSPLLGKQSGK